MLEQVVEFVGVADVLWFFTKFYVADILLQNSEQGSIMRNVAPHRYSFLLGVHLLLLHYKNNVVDEVFGAMVLEDIAELKSVVISNKYSYIAPFYKNIHLTLGTSSGYVQHTFYKRTGLVNILHRPVGESLPDGFVKHFWQRKNINC